MAKLLFIKNRMSTLLFFAISFVLVTINFPKHNINSIALIFLSLCWIASIKNVDVLKNILKQKIIVAYLILILIYVFGLFLSDDLHRGLKVIKLKIPLLLIPIIFYSIQEYITIKQSKKLKLLFIYATVFYCLFTIIAVTFNLGATNEVASSSVFEKFSHSNLTIKIDNHPTYLSYSIIVCVLFLFDLLKKKHVNKHLFTLLFSFFLVYTILLSSKIGVIIFIILSFYLIQKTLKLKHTIIFVLTIMLATITTLVLTDFGKRFSYELESIKYSKNLKDKSVPISKKNQRIIAIDIFFNQTPKQFLIGLGTGDVQNYLNKKYRYYLRTQNRNAFKGLNYHNQYFQTIADIGILGFIFLIYSIYLSLKTAISKKQMLYVNFIIITILFFSIESFFETQRGVMLYICCNSMFLFLLQKE